MCGIIGYVGWRPCQQLLLDGLTRLEDRGYAPAVRAAYARLEGHFAFVVLHRADPDALVGARRECPLVVGLGDRENFFGSNASAFLSETRTVQYVDDDQIVVLTPAGAAFSQVDGAPVEQQTLVLDWDDEIAH